MIETTTLKEANDLIGRDVRVLDSCYDWDNGGYKTSGEKLKPPRETKIMSMAVFSMPHRVSFVVYKPKIYGGYMIDGIDECWQVKDCDLELISLRAVIKSNPYPHNCPKCKAKARKSRGSVILCSNTFCKTRKQLKKPVAISPVVDNELDKDGFIVCWECDKQIINAKINDPYNHSLKVVYCPLSHHRIVLFKFGYKLRGMPQEHFVWNGIGWSNVQKD